MNILILQRRFQAFCAFGAGLSMAAMFAIIFVNSVRRYTTGKSFVWGEELPVYLAVYGFMFGLGYAYLQGRHIRFNVISDLIPRRARLWLDLAIEAAVVVIGATLAYSGWLNMLKRGEVEASSLIAVARAAADVFGLPALEILGHMSAWLFAMAFGGAVLALSALLKLLEGLRGFSEEAR